MLSVTRKLTLLHSCISIRVLGNPSLSITDMKFTLLTIPFVLSRKLLLLNQSSISLDLVRRDKFNNNISYLVTSEGCVSRFYRDVQKVRYNIM